MASFNYLELFKSFTPIEKKFAPENLFVDGDTSFLSSGLKVSIVGSRKATEIGIENAKKLTEILVRHGVIIVSGLAEGIDTIAHETAIKSDGKTIAVLGTPLSVAYPVKNAKLLEEIKRSHLAISQFSEGYPTKRENFPMRNRTMALLSDATIIVEASENSGTRHQGWEALRLGRFIFLMSNIVQDKSLTWPSEMMKYGAQELTIDILPSIIEDMPNFTGRFDYA